MSVRAIRLVSGRAFVFFWLEMPTRHHTLQFLISTGGEGSVGRGRSGRSGELEQTLIDFVQLDRQSKSSRTD